MTISLEKILLVIDRLSNPHAGTEGQFLLLIDLLQKRGVQVHAIILATTPWLNENQLPCPYSVANAGSLKSPRSWLNIYKLGKHFYAEGYRIAHIFFNDASVICPPMFAAAGIKSIISRRDMGFWYNAMYKSLLPLTGYFVTKAVCNSRAVGEVTHQVEKLPLSKISVIYNGYNRENSLSSTIPELEKLKQEGATLLGLVANIRPIKRIQDAIQAVALTDTPNIHLLIVGAGDPAELESLAHQLGVAGQIHFLGSRSDIPNLLSYLDAGLLCSESEGFSNSIVEYQFASLPVICTKTGGNPEAVEHNKNGWLYQVGDINALSTYVQKVAEDKGAAKAIGAHAKAIAETRYTTEAMINNHLSLYSEVLNK